MSIQQREGLLTPAPSLLPDDFADFYRRERPRAVQLAWLLTHGDNCEDLAQAPSSASRSSTASWTTRRPT